jgi:methylthioribulose-1-phosphate dehydratase
MPVHAGIYKSRPDAMCVVHTHPFEVVSASCHSLELVFEGEEMSKALGAKSHLETIKIPILDNPTPTEMNVFSSRVESGIGRVAKVVVLKGHGVYAWGKTPLEAMAYLEALEFLCKGRRDRG